MVFCLVVRLLILVSIVLEFLCENGEELNCVFVQYFVNTLLLLFFRM